jgi:nucleotide-binding universal stress UspA family protein
VNKSRRYLLKHIAVALSGSVVDARQLETAAQFAEQHTAEVTGVFIEDTDLLRAAGLPFAMELCRATNVVRPVQSSEIERQMHDRAVAAEKSLARFAGRHGVKWTFTKVRRPGGAAIVETARRVDVTMVAAGSNPELYRTGPAGETSASGTSRRQVVAVFDRTAAGGRGLEVANRLARMLGAPLCVLVVGRTRPGIARLTQAVRGLEHGDEVEIHDLYRADFRHVIAVARGERPGSFILPIGWMEADPARIEYAQELLRCTVLIAS